MTTLVMNESSACFVIGDLEDSSMPGTPDYFIRPKKGYQMTGKPKLKSRGDLTT